MEETNNSQPVREPQRVRANRKELVERIAQAIQADGTIQPLESLYLSRSCMPLEHLHSVFEPSLCVVAQGSKEILIGDQHYRYDPSHYLIVTVELPHVAQVLEASKERPYISLRLVLPPMLVGSVMVEAGQAATPAHVDIRAMDVSPLDVNLQDAVLRLVRLLDAPAEAPVLMPLITREIIYRLLVGNQGARLRHLAILGGFTSPIAKAVERLHQNFDQPVRVENLAHELGMSVSGLQHHFKAVTAMSPLQYQKKLRLQEARRLMLSEHLDAASAGYQVGYYDAAHFNREYKSLFGIPPMRDVQHLREEAAGSAG